MSQFTIQQHEGYQVWTIDGAERRNTLRRAMVAELEALVGKVSQDRSIRAVVITGAGDKAFCAGADLKERTTMSEAEIRAFLDSLRRTFRAMERSDCVFIAALNGVAFGGGTELALACDVRVAASTAELGLTEVKLGIIPGGGGTQRLPRLVGVGVAKELILTGRRVGAEEAQRIGLVSRVAPLPELMNVAGELASTIVANAPIALGAAKHAIDDGLALPLDESLALELRQYELVLKTEDRLEGLRAFAEKRPPRYQGR